MPYHHRPFFVIRCTILYISQAFNSFRRRFADTRFHFHRVGGDVSRGQRFQKHKEWRGRPWVDDGSASRIVKSSSFCDAHSTMATRILILLVALATLTPPGKFHHISNKSISSSVTSHALFTFFYDLVYIKNNRIDYQIMSNF